MFGHNQISGLKIQKCLTIERGEIWLWIQSSIPADGATLSLWLNLKSRKNITGVANMQIEFIFYDEYNNIRLNNITIRAGSGGFCPLKFKEFAFFFGWVL